MLQMVQCWLTNMWHRIHNVGQFVLHCNEMRKIQNVAQLICTKKTKHRSTNIWHRIQNVGQFVIYLIKLGHKMLVS